MMTINELRERLDWWATNFGENIEVVLHTVTNDSTISKGPIEGIHVDKDRKGNIKELILFGRKK
ncbi:MAG: hypothetical protein KKH70_20525 [Gammaproteobacteria bacterium]|nr:hypothetical protein [Gammaproteobacteria bacterium]